MSVTWGVNGLGNDFLRVWCQTITPTKDESFSCKNYEKISGILIQIFKNVFKNMHLKTPSAKQLPFCPYLNILTHSDRATHICIGNLTIIGSDDGLSPARHQAIIWTNDGVLLIGPLRTNIIEILIKIHTFSFKKMHLNAFCLSWTNPSVYRYRQHTQAHVQVKA